jgi:tetratricopeptide (TPR) repeat protein
MAQIQQQAGSSSQTIDYKTPTTRSGIAQGPPREPLWPAQGFARHLIVLTALLIVVGASYCNSYQSGMTLDNKYIIEEYYKAIMRMSPQLDLEGREEVKQIFKYDYWWPKGISGLYRPITTFSYWIDYVFLTGKAPKVDWNGNPIKDPQGKVITPDEWKKMTWSQYTAAPGLLNCNSYHTINLMLHWINAVLVYFVSLALLKRIWPAAFVAALFAAHPIATESVTNIIGRADIFAAFTVFAGLLVYMRSLQSNGGWRAPWLILLMMITAFGLFAKESSIAVGAVVPFYWITYRYGWSKLGLWKLLLALAVITAASCYFFSEKIAIAVAGVAGLAVIACWILFQVRESGSDVWKPLLVEFLVWFVMVPPLIGMKVTRDWVFRNASPPETPFLDNPIRGIWQVKDLNIPAFDEQLKLKPMYGMSYVECKMTAVKIMGRLLLLLAWPWTLSSDYSYSEIPNFSWHLNSWDDWQAVIALAALAAIAVVAVWLIRRGNKAAFFFIGFFFIAAFPTSNFTVTIGSVMAERFMYLPLAGFTGVVVIFVFTIAHKLWKWLQLEDPDDFPWYRVLAGAFLSLVVIIFGIRTYFRNFVWKEDQTLWEDAIQHSTRSFRCYQSLAFALYEKLEFGTKPPTIPEKLERVDKMIHVAEGALPIVDPLPDHLNSSRLYLHLGMYYSIKAELLSNRNPDGSVSNTREAAAWYQKAVDILERGSQIDRAFNEVNKAKQRLRHDPPEEITDAGLGPVYGTLGLAYARLGQYKEAIQRLEYARQLDPTDIDSYLKIATVQLSQNKFEEASTTLIQCMLMDGSRPQVWQTLMQVFGTYGERAQGALIVENNQLKLNLNHELVRWHLLQAYREFIRIFRRSHRFAMAEEAAVTAINTYHYPREIIDSLFDEPVYVVTPQGVQYDQEEKELKGYRPPKPPTTNPATTNDAGSAPAAVK